MNLHTIIWWVVLGTAFFFQSPYLTAQETVNAPNLENTKAEFQQRLDEVNADPCDIQDIPCLNDKLDQRGRLDTIARNTDIIKGNCFHGLGVKNGEKCFLPMTLVDQDNIKFLDRILTQHGFPSGKHWRPESAFWAFLLIQHGDTSRENDEGNTIRREKYLPDIKAAVQEGIIGPFSYVNTYDRVQMYREGKQTYGTQYQCGNNGPVFKGAPDITVIDQHRFEIGYETFAQSLEKATAFCKRQ